MVDFIEYIVAELKSKRLSTTDAAALVRQFSVRPSKVGGAPLHPLVQKNTSDLHGQSYASTFTGDEFFLADHRLQPAGHAAQRVLPGVAYLEMARAAVEDALPAWPEGTLLELRNTAWAQPIVVAGKKEIRVALIPGNGDEIEYEIYTFDGTEDVVHCQGQAIVARHAAPGAVDLAELGRQMTGGSVAPDGLYAACARIGLVYGPSMQAIAAIRRGEGQLLAQLRIPAVVADPAAGYVLHPSVMDGALQAAAALFETASGTNPRLPFALETLRVAAPCKPEMVAWVRLAPGSHAASTVAKLDIDLCDDLGNVCVQMRGLSWRELSVQRAEAGSFMAVPVWRASGSERATGPVEFAEHHLHICEPTPGMNIAERYTDYALACFERVQRILQSKTSGPALFQVIVRDEPEQALLAGLTGLLRTASLESPRFVGQVLLVPPDSTSEDLTSYLGNEWASGLDPLVRYRDGVRQVLRWQEVPATAEAAPVAFEDGRVYLITGGMGGLGTLFANEILERTKYAKVVLTGRSARSIERDRVAYRAADLTDLAQVEQLISWIRAEYGRLDGILHCAGTIADDFILRKPVTSFTEVLAPKVTGTFNLDSATRGDALDFLVLFSAIGGATGNVGQADYAAANAFMDQFAAYRNTQVAAGQRHGRTRSINWPLWQAGGMQADAGTQEKLRQASGMRPMDTASGLRAFHRALALPHDQALVVDGDLAAIRRTFLHRTASPARVPERPAADPAIDPDRFAESMQEWLRKQFSAVLKVPAQQLDPRAALENYGIDSIVAMNLTSQLEIAFGSLPKTLFFEYQTIRELAAYFVAEHGAKAAAILQPDRKLPVDSTALVVQAPAAAPAKLVSGRRFLRSKSAAPAAATTESEPIAIIGLSGRYPEAVDVEAYWRNLRDGKDCITEVPKERWDWREYYSDDRSKSGHHYSKWGGFISGVDEFDPLFFNISPVEAELMDPQERLFLQHAWMAIEDAGYTRASLQLPDAQDLPGQVGVYVGLMYTEYQMLGAAALAQGKRIGVASSAGSIANRVSYLLNLHGPSMTLDTMCSSSLSAIHLASQDLKQGRTSLAIAGGVNVSVHPNKYFVLSAGQFISGDGHCQSFGEGGDGYIPGEGVGVVVLKRLSDAQRDGDHIYGVIRGSALNHGGKTNGYTVPSPQAQASVIRRALVEAGVDARRVSYIEAHGTGTKLGDPIEIAALSKAFATEETGFCLIGSAKSNVGHCESAAGIAGLTKILLQMQHRQIVPSLHSARLNPHIDFEHTPFVVNQELRPWEQPVVDGRPVPRIAGISSFGAGGSNAHMIVEEYLPPAVQPVAFDEVVILLSARTAEQLRQRAQDLLDFVRARETTIDLAATAYTLQVGREAMDERLGFVVTSVDELLAKLEAYLAGEQAVDGLHQGQVKRNREALALFSDSDLQQAVAKWVENHKTAKLLELWVKGLEVDWTRFHGENKPQRTSLPVYPFAKERYWVDTTPGTVVHGAVAAVLHPLLHANTSDLSEQRYSSTFTGEEFFFTDHQVQADGRTAKVLPAVAYLEMARAAIERALPVPPESAVLELRNTAWSQPIVASGKTQVDIALIAADDDQVDYEIYSGDTIHCQGRAVWSPQAAAPRHDLEQLRGRMDRGALDAERVYAACARMGLAYGPAFRAVTSILRGHGEVLAQLTLPATPSAGDYVLHPSVMDGALQAAIGLLQTEDEAVALRLPFALETLRVLWPCSGEMAAWVRFASGTQRGDAVIKLEVDLCDARGIVCVELRGLALRALPGQLRPAAGSLFAAPVWRTDESSVAIETKYAEQHVMVLQADARQNIAGHYTDSAVACFNRIQEIFRRKPEGKVLFQVVVADDGEQRLFAGLAALLRTARMENPQFTGQLLLVPAATSGEELERWWRDEANRPAETLVRYRDGARQVLRWEEIAADGDQPPVAFKRDGVYLITGGAGGLGLLFAREILDRAADARVILTGRSTREIPIHSDRLSYRQADLADADEVEHLIASIRDEYGRLDGILHSAGMVADRLLLQKTAAEFRDVLAPKVTGTFNLDQATKDVGLDFFVLFSSLAGAMGNAGQADYATANAFMDEFAAHRNHQVAAGQRHGRTRSINWPLWEAGGMQIAPEDQERLERIGGVRPMQTATGMSAFHRALAQPHDQLLVAEGDVSRMRRVLLAGPAQPTAASEPAAVVVPAEVADLVGKTQDFLRKEFSELLKLPAHKIDPQAALENYGIDSVHAMRLTSRLEETFGSLSKTLFFEYQTIAAMAGYFAKAHSAILREKLGAPSAPVVAKSVAQQSPAPAPSRRRKRALAAKAKPAESEIAIVGLAGRYPQAENVQAFWRNLRDGLDCITEIPADRWDHTQYFDHDPNRPGSTYSKWGGFIADVDKFDPLFFNISPKEAAITDPQERLFLQTAWECIEDAGYTKNSISGSRVGVYVGAMWNHYELFGAEAVARGEAVVPISSHSSIANRVSYFFDLHGPSIALDTMCSSSLTAIHLACEELRKGTIGAALAGGVNLTIHPYKYLSLSQGKFIASDGRCRSFGEGGDGYVPGEGVGAILLKRLDDAVRDGDQIYAVVRSSALNHGGKTNGYTVPNPVAQGDLIVEAFRQANVDPKTVGYVETHGTGTSLGDPIEITGLRKAFEVGAETQFCPIGSVKSNIGHLESAAGIAAVTKALLQIRHRQLVPSLHASPLNPNIDFAGSPFYVQTELAEWKSRSGQPRRVAVSSFGAGGSNAHLILEEYPRDDRSAVSATDGVGAPELFLLSAKNPDALRRYAERVVRFLEGGAGVPLRDLAYTSQVGRTPMDVRLAILASTPDELQGKLTEWLAGADLENVFYGNTKDAAFRAAAVIDGQAGKAFVRDLLTRRDLERVAPLWTLGVDVDWSLLARPAKAARVSLPTYPFAKERCWIPQAAAMRNVVAAPAEPREEKRTLYFVPQWTETPLAAGEGSAAAGPILILDDTDRLFLAVRERHADTVWLRPGDTFGEIEPNVYVVDPEREDHFRDLLDALHGKSLVPSLVLHHAPDPCVLKVHQDVARELQHTLYSLLFLTKAMLLRKQQTLPRLVSLFSSEGDATPPLGAAVAGFFRTLTLEDPRYLAKAIEIPGELPVSERVDLLWNELRERGWTTQEIRYRGDVRAVRGLAPQPAPAAPASELPLRKNGVYLITGGMGGLGLIFARHLATSVQAKLVLVGRSAPNAAQQQRIAELEAAGAEVLCLQADVTLKQDVQRIVRETKERFSEIHGVIHAAGVYRDAFVLKKTMAEMEAVLAPKIYGAINLDRATRSENLELFVLFSSVAGVLGNVGQADYAYANRFLDCFAERREYRRSAGKRSGRTLSIDWPLWEGAGMSISAEDVALLEKRAGIVPLPAHDGIRVWEDFLRADVTQGVAVHGLPSRIAAFVSREPAAAPRKTAAPAPPATDAPSLAAKSEAYVKTLIGNEIGLEPERIDPSDRLDSFGIDSLMINRINAQLEAALGALPKTLFYEHETVRDVARFLARHSPEALAAFLGEAEAPAPVAPVHDEPVEQQAALPVVPARAAEAEAGGEIAVIGIHVRFPHSPTLDAYWENLREGRTLIDVVPRDRWDAAALYDANRAASADGKIYCKWGGFLEDHDKFDPRFFQISADEAKLMDPQERLFLESVWSAIEDAGYTRDRLKARYPKGQSANVGVFVGVTTNSYHLLTADEWARGNFVTPSAMPWSIANRVSYFFDFNGPSTPVDAACSSSHVALHLACESLQKRECGLAVAGGVNLYLHPSKYHGLCQQGALAADDQCRSYGTGGEGFVPGEGVGTLVLKPLSKAKEDGDRIYAVIRASASEHSGRSHGYSVPNPNAQASLIARTIEQAGVEPESISYVEGHGTGIQMGDAVELAALTQAFRKRTEKNGFCAIGSVKANIGHTESAAGIAAVAKVILQMQHRQLAPAIHAGQPNPDIAFADTPFHLQEGLSEWKASGPRRAIVHSFGAGGVNACLLLEEHVEESRSDGAQETGPFVFNLSASNEERLHDYAGRMLATLRQQPRIDLASLCHTLQTGREAMKERLAVVVSDVDQLIDRLTEWSKRGSAADVHRGTAAPRRSSKRSVVSTALGADAAALNGLASRWVSGEDVDWQSLYLRAPRLVTLPTYPFARERYWVADAPAAAKPAPRLGQLHPLVGYNSSTLREVSFSSTLSPDAFYAVDHKVHDESIFPGAGYLEMACVAATIAGEQRVRKLTGIVWASPLSFRTGAQTVRTTLRPDGNDIEFEISSLDDENEKLVHSEGRLVLGNAPAHAAEGEDRLVLEALRERSAKTGERVALYDRFRAYGLQYGPSFQTVQELYVNGTFALSRLKIAEHLQGEFDEFVLHPAIVDGALQTVAGLVGNHDATAVHLPFALDEIELLRPVPRACYAYAERADAQAQGRGGVAKFNIRILNENGDVLVRMNNLYVRPFGLALPEKRPIVAAPQAHQRGLDALEGESIN